MPRLASHSPSTLALLFLAVIATPAWSKDGRELFFRDGPQFLAVEISSESDFRASAPKLLHEVRFDRGIPLWPKYYDVAPDGRFLVVEDRSTTQFNVVLNWFEELKQRVPTGND